MENLELQEKVINLGKLFVKEFKLDPGVDTFSRWMAHYLAEKISVTEQLEGNEKEAAEKECFDVILKLWQHRHSLPSGRRPFQSFEPILDTLSKLNPDTEESYFYNALRNQDLAELEIDNLAHKSVNEWMSLVKDIDKIARVWIGYALGRAADNAEDERTKQWIRNAVNNHDDAVIIERVLSNFSTSDLENYEDEKVQKKYQIEVLKRRIMMLNKFSTLNEVLLSNFKADLASAEADL